jgi:hypothetical protein
MIHRRYTNQQTINMILLCICDGMNIAFNGFYNFVFSIVSSLSDFDYYKYVTL